jgi:acetyl esterase/lipase
MTATRESIVKCSAQFIGNAAIEPVGLLPTDMLSSRTLSKLLPLCTLLLSACSALSFGIANLPARFAHAERIANVPFGPQRWQQADVYRPPRAAGPLPVIVFWYGGSWVEGNKEEYRFVGTALASLGCVVVLPNYRLYPQVKFPTFLEDGAAAVAWVQSHAAQYGGDAHRIVLMGHSAGAHMAAMLAIDHAYLRRAGVDTRNIVGLIGLSGPYELAPDTPTLNAIFAAPYTARDWQVLPFVSADAPPTLLIQGADDNVVRASNTQHLAQALRRARVPVEVKIYPNRGHGDTVAALAWAVRFRSPTLKDIDAFMHSLKAPPCPRPAGRAACDAPAH